MIWFLHSNPLVKVKKDDCGHDHHRLLQIKQGKSSFKEENPCNISAVNQQNKFMGEFSELLTFNAFTDLKKKIKIKRNILTMQ